MGIKQKEKMNYYTPANKRDLIKWINSKQSTWKLKGMKIKQLYAIFYRLKERK